MIELEEMPDEVIVNIFSYLSLVDRKNTRLVSKRWYQLSYSMCLIKNDITVVNNYLLLDNTISPNVRHINIRTRLVDDKNCSLLPRLRAIKFWSTYGQDIKSVEIYLIDGYQEVLLDIFENCPNLEHLFLSYWYDNFSLRSRPRIFPSTVPYGIEFPKLLSLSLNNMSYLSTEALQRLTEKAPNLERISLEWWMEQEQDHGILDVFLEVVRRQSHQLKEISLSHSSITDKYVIQIAEILGPQLTGFYINHCENLTNLCIPIIAKRLTNIKKLDIGKCSFTKDSYVTLFSGLTKLTHVCLRTKNITNADLAALKFAPNLETLDITDCWYVTDKGIIQFFGDSVKVKMMDLRLSRVDRITDEAIVKISPNLPNLRTLYLNGCIGLSDTSLEAIFTHNRLLRCFSIQGCILMRDLSVGPSINALKGLIRLDVFGCHISAKSVNSLKLIELRKAYLNVEDLTVEDISKVLNGCPSLQYLYLDNKLKPVENKIKYNKIAPVIQYGFPGFEPDSLFDHTRLLSIT